MKIVPPKKGGAVILEGFGAALSAISQEILYRGLVFFSFQHLGVAFATAISACLFVAEHLANRWATREFDTSEYLKQIGLSVICCLLCALTGGAAAAVLMHLGYNIVPVARNLVHKRHFERATGNA
ncbi:MAG: CPBP family intramembrane metalloprotease [Rhodospirillales bacterium]|nr:CPBP family intramembrane metalloprotease [Rhodospirillales bacterium]